MGRCEPRSVATKERPFDRGQRRGLTTIAQLARELRAARQDRGLSLAEVARAVRVSEATLSRIERGRSEGVSLVQLCKVAEAVGLELSSRLFAGGQPVRDTAHLRLLESFRQQLHPSIRWATEAPLPMPGDQRAWDALIAAGDQRYGVEAETAPRDGQALARRLELKQRDGQVDGIILLLRSSRQTAEFLATAREVLRGNFPIDGRRALELLAAGATPGGSAIVILQPLAK